LVCLRSRGPPGGPRNSPKPRQIVAGGLPGAPGPPRARVLVREAWGVRSGLAGGSSGFLVSPRKFPRPAWGHGEESGRRKPASRSPPLSFRLSRAPPEIVFVCFILDNAWPWLLGLDVSVEVRPFCFFICERERELSLDLRHQVVCRSTVKASEFCMPAKGSRAHGTSQVHPDPPGPGPKP
jgi:hypothetical protein